MTRDREKVLAVGMNDHIAKPINVDDMFKTMAKWVTPKNNSPLPNKPTAPQQETDTDLIPLELPGIDTEAGLAITQGNHKLYLKLLNKFHDGQADFVERFTKARHHKTDSMAAERCAHSLKGVAGNIGANILMNAAADLEQACMHNLTDIELDKALTAVQTPLCQVLTSLSSATLSKKRKPGSGQTLDQEAFKVLLHRLSQLLQDNDTDAIEVIDELHQLPGIEQYSSILNKLTKAIEAYDFEQGLKVLNKLVTP